MTNFLGSLIPVMLFEEQLNYVVLCIEYRIFSTKVALEHLALGIFAERIFAEGIFAEGIFAERKIRRKKFSPKGNFAERSYHRVNFRGTEFQPKSSLKLSQ